MSTPAGGTRGSPLAGLCSEVPKLLREPSYHGPMPEVQLCPVEEAIHVIGGKWKLLVLRSLLLNGPQCYSQLLATVSGISQKELTRNLRELAGAGLLMRDASEAGSAAYSLTTLGKGLMPMFQKMLTWGQGLLRERA